VRALEDIERDLHAARRDVFSDDPCVALTAEAAITRLRDEMRRHPEERARRARVRAAQDERLLRLWA
jgi:hypothetical protein